MAASRPIWTGTISFGLVNIPIRLFTAVREHRVSFHMLHDQDNARVRRKLVGSDDREVHNEHIVKGYEISKDQYVIIKPEDLEACSPAATKTIDITDFVDLAAIDPIYYDHPYYVMPQPAAVKPYRLLAEAMQRTQKVGVSKLVMHDKSYLAALRPIEGGVICLHTMHFGPEVLPPSSAGHVPPDAKANDREMKMAEQLIASLESDFDPNKYKDDYVECVLAMIERKSHGEKIVSEPTAAAKPAHAKDLMAALEASLAEAKTASAGRSRNGNGAHRNGSTGNGHGASENGNGSANGNGSHANGSKADDDDSDAAPRNGSAAPRSPRGAKRAPAAAGARGSARRRPA